MNERRKVAVSIRMPAKDVRKIKTIASRLDVRESDVVRFSVKLMLAKLEPLCSPGLAGRSLIPLFVESGSELLRYFDVDAARLEAIINQDASPDRRVQPDDIALIVLASAQQPLAALRLTELNHSEERSVADAREVSRSLRQYLYEKYVYRGSEAGLHEPRPFPGSGVINE